MARRTKRKFSADFKLKVALAAIKEEKTVSALCQEFELSATQIKDWKDQFLAHSISAFEVQAKGESQRTKARDSVQESALFEQIGRLKMELEWLKKKLT